MHSCCHHHAPHSSHLRGNSRVEMGATRSALVGNAAAKAASRADPTRLRKERRAFMAEVRRRWAELRRELLKTILTEDDYGLAPVEVGSPFLNARRYRFQTSSQKMETFSSWLQSQVDGKALSLAKGENAWTAKYIDSAFRKGVVRAYTDTHRATKVLRPSFYEGSQAEFLRSTFAAPESADKVRLIATRTFNGMKGLTEQMKTRLGTVLADGLANGLGPREVARRMARELDISKKRALTIARTEMTSAHAEGQLLGFKELEMDELEVMAEWLTAGDDRVCGLCAPLEGQVFTIKEAQGMIPRHPNCRCAWMPAEARKPKKKDRERRARLLDRSVKAEKRAKSAEAARKASTWVGADV